MVYLITSPLVLHPGNYRCQPISADEAVKLIKQASEDGSLRPLVNFGSTRFVLQQLCGIKFDLARKITIPAPSEGDVYIDVRLKSEAAKDRLGIEDLEFFQIDVKRKT